MMLRSDECCDGLICEREKHICRKPEDVPGSCIDKNNKDGLVGIIPDVAAPYIFGGLKNSGDDDMDDDDEA